MWPGNEIDLIAYVQGKKISLVNQESIGSPEDIVPENKVVTLDNIGAKTPLSIMTVAYEADGCSRFPFPDDIHERVVKNFVPFPSFSSVNPLGNYPHLRGIQEEFNSKIHSLCDADDDKHEILGNINKVYQPTSFGAGSHTEASSGEYPDFRLTYHIEVIPPFNTIDK